MPKVCSFRGAREIVMKRVWEKADKLEARGIPVTHELFGQLIKEEWKRVKDEAAKVCPIMSLEEVKKIIGEFKIEGSEATSTTTEVERPIEAKIGVSIKAQKIEE